MKKFLKIFALVCVSLLVLELLLQWLAVKVNPYRSYPEFFDQALAEVRQSDPRKTIYFVGDSTMYGGGSTDPTKYSMPALLGKLLERKSAGLRILNLGYPGTTGKHHIDVLRQLPEKAFVVVRTGINDSWNRYDYYKFYLFGKYYEIRLLKFLVIFYHGWSRDPEANSVSNHFYDELQKVAKEKQFQLYFVDYFLGDKTFMNTFFRGRDHFIDLAQRLKQAGFYDQRGFIQRKYLSFDLLHANDLGYRLQALSVFNFFSEKSQLGLSPKDALPMILEQSEIQRLRKRLESIKASLIDPKNDPVEHFPNLLNGTWQLYLLTGDQELKRDYQFLLINDLMRH